MARVAPSKGCGFGKRAPASPQCQDQKSSPGGCKQCNSDVGNEFAGHGTVKHSEEEYVRNEVWIDKENRLHIDSIHTNTVEGYYSIFKRGMIGVYQHCKEKHLHRYLAEFDFRYSNRIRLGVDDTGRTQRALRGIVGKRLMYRDSSNASS